MVKRRSFEEGHRRKFLVVVDETPECDRALSYAAVCAERTSGAVVMLYCIALADFQHWLGVENIMRAEAMEEAETTLARAAEKIRAVARIDPESVIVEGTLSSEIIKLIEEDQDIAILVLAAGTSSEGPGPLVSSFASKSAGFFPIPVTIVPGTPLSDEDITTLA
ncbi:universal stress protein [Breoghania sp.]|uniref:universal stress protein n=1 Tax=Breoghania sp. TaxID=2065378 RepID=UPI00261560B9|nr:universal stress protein [Breoghania sp.]MDJ0930889.1 universal stress protein [Breoghania sp.]